MQSKNFEKSKPDAYGNRLTIPVGSSFGFTSTPVSQLPSPQSTPPPISPYKYQPSLQWSHPEIEFSLSHNYLEAVAAKASLGKDNDGQITPPEDDDAAKSLQTLEMPAKSLQTLKMPAKLEDECRSCRCKESEWKNGCKEGKALEW